MAQSWEEKYKAKGNYFYPIASHALQARPLSDSSILRSAPHLTIGYAGSLAYGYREGIEEILPAFEYTNTSLNIYRDNEVLLPKSENLVFAGYSNTSEETWERIKAECDAVILPYSTNEKFSKLYSTHFPSKLPEYLALGMPVIIFGPEYANGVKWAKSKESFLSAGDTQRLIEIITSLKIDSAGRIRIVKFQSYITDFRKEFPFDDLTNDQN
jgi:glycosyltransferase involved in cell wall biosynthesis